MKRRVKAAMRYLLAILLLVVLFAGAFPAGYSVPKVLATEAEGQTAEEPEQPEEPVKEEEPEKKEEEPEKKEEEPQKKEEEPEKKEDPEKKEEPQQPEEPQPQQPEEPQPQQPEEPQGTVSLLASTSNMTINVTEGEDFRQGFSVQNVGNATADLCWSFSGIECVGMEIIGQTLGAGQIAACYVKNTGNLNIGTYNGSAYVGVQGAADTTAEGKLVRVNVTINVKAKETPKPDPEPTPTPTPTPTPVPEEDSYIVDIAAKPSEGGQVSGGGLVKKGGSVDVLAAANNGYTFKGWTIDGSSVSKSNRYTVKNVKSDTTLIANFTQEKVYITLKASPSDYGKVSDSGYVTPGDSFEIKATPKSGYHFVCWKEDGEKISTERKLTLKNVTTDRKLKAIFEPDSYKVKIVLSPEGAGTFAGNGTFAAGKDVTVKANPDNGYTFVGWAINGKVVSTDRSFTLKDIDADYTLVALMQREGATTYDIKASVSGAGGKVTPSGTTKVAEGSNMRYSFTPDTGYRVKEIVVDKTTFPAGEFFTFTKVTGAHNITVSFEKIPQKQAADSSNTTLKQAASAASSSSAVTTAKKQAPGETDEEYSQALAEDVAKYWGGEDQTNDGEDLWSEEEVHQVSGVLEEYNLSASQARELIKSGKGSPLLTAAYLEGYIDVTVNNSYGQSRQETGDGTVLTDSSIPNLMDVVQTVVTEDEAIDILSGKPLALNLSISNYDENVSELDKKQIEASAKADKYQVAEYMDVNFMKVVDGQVTAVTELDSPMEIVFKVPESLKNKSKDLAVVRLHYYADGSAERTILEDLDSDPDTVTIKTDKFSVYAFAYPSSGIDMKNLLFFAAVVIAFSATVVLLIVTVKKLRGGR